MKNDFQLKQFQKLAEFKCQPMLYSNLLDRYKTSLKLFVDCFRETHH